jgi:hypothetical protein
MVSLFNIGFYGPEKQTSNSFNFSMQPGTLPGWLAGVFPSPGVGAGRARHATQFTSNWAADMAGVSSFAIQVSSST